MNQDQEKAHSTRSTTDPANVLEPVANPEALVHTRSADTRDDPTLETDMASGNTQGVRSDPVLVATNYDAGPSTRNEDPAQQPGDDTSPQPDKPDSVIPVSPVNKEPTLQPDTDNAGAVSKDAQDTSAPKEQVKHTEFVQVVCSVLSSMVTPDGHINPSMLRAFGIKTLIGRPAPLGVTTTQSAPRQMRLRE